MAGGSSSRDWRVICSCQQHSVLEPQQLARTVVRAGKRGGAVIVLIASLGFGAVNFPQPLNQFASTAAAVTSPKSGGDVQLVAERALAAAERNAAAMFGIRTGQTLISEQVKEEFFRGNVPYGEFIYEEATRNGLAPELVAAVIEAESNFRPSLRSSKNAVGLMQVLPSTGRLMGTDDLLDPYENVRAGTRYLKYLKSRFKGDVVMMLAAYNAGEGNIERFGGMPPFRETLEYIRRVTMSRDRLARELTYRTMEAQGVRLPARPRFRMRVLRNTPSSTVVRADRQAPQQQRIDSSEESSEEGPAAPPHLLVGSGNLVDQPAASTAVAPVTSPVPSAISDSNGAQPSVGSINEGDAN